MVSIQVCCAIDKPSEVQHSNVSQSPTHKEGWPEALPPEMTSNLSGEHEAHVKSEKWIKLLLEHDSRVFVQVAEVQFFSGPDNLRVFLDVQPSHVGEEESAHGIVGVGVGFGVFMVDTVIAGPVEDGSLVGD